MSPGPHRRRRHIANALLATAVLLCAALFFAPPGEATFWPACPIHQLLGMDCPGCGATRALEALLHGQLRHALSLNGLFVVLLPFGIAAAAQSYRRALEARPFRWPNPPRFAINSAVVASVAFTIARNLAH